MPTKSAGEKILEKLNNAGYAAYYVGGMVRDSLLGNTIYDIDITTQATPQQILNLFEKAIPTGLKHGTVTVVADKENIEVTTFRLDGDYLDARHPEKVTFTDSLHIDLARRDFTINAMAKNIDGLIIDPFNGKIDLKEKKIRAVGLPIKRFEEDALRILRGFRFVAKLGFDIEEETLQAMISCCHLIKKLSFERIRKELEEIINGKYRYKALKLMRDTNLYNNIPYFETFANFSDTEIQRLADFKLIILLIAKNRSIREKFLEEFPLTKSEKKLIKNIDTIIHDYNYLDEANQIEKDKLIQYYYSTDMVKMLKKCIYFKDCYNDQTRTFIPYDLPIKDSSEIIIKPKEIIKLSKLSPGNWLSELLTVMQNQIILENITNERQELIKFMQERGIIDVEKD